MTSEPGTNGKCDDCSGKYKYPSPVNFLITIHTPSPIHGLIQRRNAVLIYAGAAGKLPAAPDLSFLYYFSNTVWPSTGV